MNIGQVYRIEWVDSMYLSNGGWKRLSEVLELREKARIVTAGIVVDVTDDFVILVGTRGAKLSREVQGDILIPRGCIKNATELRC
jgi:hypothetical protein